MTLAHKKEKREQGNSKSYLTHLVFFYKVCRSMGCINNFRFIAWSLPLLILSVGCGTSNHPPELDQSFVSSLAQTHVNELAQTVRPAQVNQFNNNKNQAFQKLFGGTSSDHVQDFIHSRVKYFLNILTSSNQLFISPPPRNPHQKWINSTLISPHPGESVAPFSFVNNSRNSQKDLVGAANISIQYWLQGLIDHEEYSLVFPNGANISLNHPREGVITIGPRYSTQLDQTPYPKIVSQSMLIHEARHSDCSGGIAQRDLIHMKYSQNYQEFISHSQSKKCGYLHELCPNSHSLGGIAACDSIPWGAYTAGIIFLDAALYGTTALNPGPSVHSSSEWQVATIQLLELKTRLLFDYDRMISGHLGDPDLTSSGLK